MIASEWAGCGCVDSMLLQADQSGISDKKLMYLYLACVRRGVGLFPLESVTTVCDAVLAHLDDGFSLESGSGLQAALDEQITRAWLHRDECARSCQFLQSPEYASAGAICMALMAARGLLAPRPMRVSRSGYDGNPELPREDYRRGTPTTLMQAAFGEHAVSVALQGWEQRVPPRWFLRARGVAHRDQEMYSIVATTFDAGKAEESARQAVMLRDIFNPWPTTTLDVSGLGRDTVGLLQRVIRNRDPLESELVANHLLDSGFQNEQIVSHFCRQAIHEPGCWAADLLLSSLSGCSQHLRE